MAQEQGTSGDEQLRATEIVSEPMVDQVPVAVDDAQDELHGTDEPVRMDYSHSTRQELANIIRELAQETDQRRVDSTLREIKPVWDDLQERERSNALQRFLESGGTKEDFSYKADELDNLFDGTFKLLRDRRARNLKEQDEQRQRNLIRKQELLEQLRTLVDSEDNASSMKAFKEIQAGWKKAGAVPANFNKDLWASYHALVDRFYDQRSILFELKELDRRKNLEAKQELVMRAEKLMASERINDAVKELNELHNEFRHIGPVPKEEQEALWLQFKKASDAVYEKRDAFVKELTINLHKNLEQKNTLLATIEPFATYQTDRIKEWNEKTREILALQKQW
ncbi:MAG: DUF349 domain-containing protein, partial [Cyclobacteriaceae bacterium]|nr:DUF349 domain-containing protein [Cyclobacteriaceae bacterium]